MATAAATPLASTALVVPRLLGLLLLLVLEQLLPPDFLLPLLREVPLQVAAVRDGARVGPQRALARVHLNQAKNAAADLATAANAHRARAAVVEQLLHFAASHEVAFVVLARRRVHKRLEEELQRTLALAPGILAAALVDLHLLHVARHLVRREVVYVVHALAAVRAKVEVGAHLAVEALDPKNVLVARVARVNVRGRLRVVKVVQHHERRVLRAAQLVKLVPIPRAQAQQEVPRVAHGALHPRVPVVRLHGNEHLPVDKHVARAETPQILRQHCVTRTGARARAGAGSDPPGAGVSKRVPSFPTS